MSAERQYRYLFFPPREARRGGGAEAVGLRAHLGTLRRFMRGRRRLQRRRPLRGWLKSGG
eukprot:2654670-Pyramimonas_sp.AAC.1